MIFPQNATECRTLTPDGFEAPGGISHVTVIQRAMGGAKPLAVGPASKAPDMIWAGWSTCGVCAEVCIQTPLRPSLYLPLHDGMNFDEGAIENALRDALALWRSSNGLYVFCMGGRSRSTSFAAGLIHVAGYIGNYHLCFEHVQKLHPSTGAMPEPRGTIARVAERLAEKIRAEEEAVRS